MSRNLNAAKERSRSQPEPPTVIVTTTHPAPRRTRTRARQLAPAQCCLPLTEADATWPSIDHDDNHDSSSECNALATLASDNLPRRHGDRDRDNLNGASIWTGFTYAAQAPRLAVIMYHDHSANLKRDRDLGGLLVPQCQWYTMIPGRPRIRAWVHTVSFIRANQFDKGTRRPPCGVTNIYIDKMLRLRPCIVKPACFNFSASTKVV